MVGVVPTPFAGAYCASKAALHVLSEVLRMEVRPFGIEGVVVEPGRVRSEVAEKAPVDLERYACPTSLHHRVAPQIERRSRASQQDPTETDAFARRLGDALTRRRTPRVVRLGRGTGLVPLLAGMPGALRDRLFARRFGLAALRAGRGQLASRPPAPGGALRRRRKSEEELDHLSSD